MNLAAALLLTAATDPGRTAIRGAAGADVTFAELAARAARWATLVADRVAPGERVAILAGNEVAFFVAYLGVLGAGAVAVPLNSTAPSAELRRELAVVEPALVVASSAHTQVAQRAARSDAGELEVVVVDDGATEGVASAEFVARSPHDLAALLFTTGTAGPPKPAMLTHGSLLANLEQLQGHPGLALRSTDVGLGVLPFFHIFGLNVVLGLSLFSGASVVPVEHFHPAETLAAVRSREVTVIAAVPAVYSAWLALDAATAPAGAFSGVRLAVSGAAALPADIARGMLERFGVVVREGYGLTEASPVVATSAVDARVRPGSIGPSLPGVDVRLVDTDGADVLAGDPGEIRVRGPNVFAGYWHDAEATARVLTADGWLCTGDIAVADDDGWLTLVDRSKDLVIVSGFNVFPAEVEDALADHPDVAEVAVVGEAHPRTGETVVAYVVAKQSRTPDPVELVRHAGRRLARYKLPTRVEFVAELPRAFGGKLLRRELSRGSNDAGASSLLEATENPA